jgi:hypothetical protein
MNTIDIRSCSLVSKSWNRAAQFFIKGLHVKPTDMQLLFQDLQAFPMFAEKITKFTIVQSVATSDYISAINLCPNLLTLWFKLGHAFQTLKRLDESLINLSKIQEIRVHATSMGHCDHLWSCFYRYKETLTKLRIDYHRPMHSYFANITECITAFPRLQELEIGSCSKINLHDLLVQDSHIQKLYIFNVGAVDYIGESQGYPNIPQNLLEITLNHSMVHINTLRFLAEISGKLKRIEINVKYIVASKDHDKIELNNILGHFPSLESKYIIFVTEDLVTYYHPEYL